MSSEPEWSATYRKVGEVAIPLSRARWLAVEARSTQRPSTLVELPVEDEAAGQRLIARLESWVDPAAVAVIGGGVSGRKVWIAYADPMNDGPDATDPMGSQDVVTLGLELTAVIQRARAVGLPVPPIDPRLVVHDFTSDGTFRPRLLGVGTPGPATTETELAAEIGAGLWASLIGRDPRGLGWAPGQAPPMSFHEARGGRVPPELEQTITRAMALGYASLDILRADLSSTSLTKSRVAPRVGVVTDRYALRARRPGENSIVAPLPVAPLIVETAAPVAPPQAESRRKWLVPLLAVAALAVIVFLLVRPGDAGAPDGGKPQLAGREPSTGSAPVGASPATSPPDAVAMAPQDATVAEVAPDTAALEATTVDTTPSAPEAMVAAAPDSAPDSAPETSATAPETAQATATSAIPLASNPIGALVFLDNEPLGRTPLEVKLPVDRFPVTLRLEKRGYASEKVVLETADAKPERVRMKAVGGARPQGPTGDGGTKNNGGGDPGIILER